MKSNALWKPCNARFHQKEFAGKLDLVILDIGMPGMGGHACLRELGLKVLISRRYFSAGQIKDLLEQGAHAYLTEPYKRTDLMAKVNDLLETGKLRPQARSRFRGGAMGD